MKMNKKRPRIRKPHNERRPTHDPIRTFFRHNREWSTGKQCCPGCECYRLEHISHVEVHRETLENTLYSDCYRCLCCGSNILVWHVVPDIPI
jgi:hypothetical protein